jgi:hypothetical protein
MFDFFARHRIPSVESVRQVDFTTMNPAINSQDRWVQIWAQEHSLQPSRVTLQLDPGRQRFIGTTKNVARLALDVPQVKLTQPVILDLDGEKLTNAAATRLWLFRNEGHWQISGAPPVSEKSPLRAGPFKEGFRHRMQFVYGTHGTPEENAWAFAKARFDAESFWYRGNGSVDVLADTSFNPRAEAERNIILYGHREMNSAWEPLLGASPVQAARGRISVGTRNYTGTDLACLLVRPRPGSTTASVVAVAGSGAAGLHVTDKLPYFMAGLAYPDCYVVSADSLIKGIEGIRAAGFFGRDWSVETGDFAFHD